MAQVNNLQQFLDAIAADWGISPKFRQSSDHPYSCRCDGCKDWWRTIGPDEDGLYGPFTKEELGLDTE